MAVKKAVQEGQGQKGTGKKSGSQRAKPKWVKFGMRGLRPVRYGRRGLRMRGSPPHHLLRNTNEKEARQKINPFLLPGDLGPILSGEQGLLFLPYLFLLSLSFPGIPLAWKHLTLRTPGRRILSSRAGAPENNISRPPGR